MQSKQDTQGEEFRQEMPYKGATRGGETPTTGYVAPTHAHITNRVREAQLKEIGLCYKEDYYDDKIGEYRLRRQRIKRICLLFTAIFILSLAVGAVVSVFWGQKIILGMGIGAAIFVVLVLLPVSIYLLTVKVRNRNKNKK